MGGDLSVLWFGDDGVEALEGGVEALEDGVEALVEGLGVELGDVGAGDIGDVTDFSSSDFSETVPADVLV